MYQVGSRNAVRAYSRPICADESRYASYVRKICHCCIWSLSACTLLRATCSSSWTETHGARSNSDPEHLLYAKHRSDIPRNYTVQIFCPICRDIYNPRSSRSAAIDGAYFGTTFPHLFFITFPELVPSTLSHQYVASAYAMAAMLTTECST